MQTEPNWDALATAYRNASTADEKDAAFDAICEWIAADLPDDAPDGAEIAGAIQFLNNRGIAFG